MHDNKNHANVTTWIQEQFFKPTPILTHRCFLKQASQDFRVKQLAKFQILTNPS